jgi:hypothetical protein
MPAPPRDKGGRRLRAAADGPDTPSDHNSAEGQTTIPADPDRRPVDGATVVDLDERRSRRLARPWPGWWGRHELTTWTWAERSRTAERPPRRCCA